MDPGVKVASISSTVALAVAVIGVIATGISATSCVLTSTTWRRRSLPATSTGASSRRAPPASVGSS